LLDAQVDLNPHQVEAALFAFKSPLSKGAILADEVGRFTAATRRPWMDLENTAAIFAAAAKRHTVLLLLLRVSSQSTSEAVLN